MSSVKKDVVTWSKGYRGIRCGQPGSGRADGARCGQGHRDGLCGRHLRRGGSRRRKRGETRRNGLDGGVGRGKNREQMLPFRHREGRKHRGGDKKCNNFRERICREIKKL